MMMMMMMFNVFGAVLLDSYYRFQDTKFDIFLSSS